MFRESEYHFGPPYYYEQGIGRYCLACWLGVGPADRAAMEASEGGERALPGGPGSSE